MTSPASIGVLAIMVKAPRAGHVKTRLLPAYAPQSVVDLYRALVEDTVELARSVTSRVVAVCPASDGVAVRDWLPDTVRVVEQRGSGLADGLRSAFEILCTPDRDPVIAFNADSPHLEPDQLASAFSALASHDLVVGPCDDGGYYLVGATAPHLELFEAPAIGTSSACDALLMQARMRGLSCWLAAEHYDIDLAADLERLAQELLAHPERAPRTAAALSRAKLSYG